jgi:hypothetical protein
LNVWLVAIRLPKLRYASPAVYKAGCSLLFRLF